jgi:hypothetical protein
MFQLHCDSLYAGVTLERLYSLDIFIWNKLDIEKLALKTRFLRQLLV